ncbi:hypothetical protein Bca52824_053666 [Brassica carinata]|uniref:Uncharacterized protein n=1 Tax=Brassica carinata TaxID=52824 RepID=A0A8X7R628_BRACI|nr:hypothetical protein Bca52824_053666 [Brassica carinata]
MMVIGGRDITSIPSEYFNPSHLGARNDVFSPDLNLTQLETPLQGRITQRITNWFLLVPAGSGSYHEIRFPATFRNPWFLLVPSPILRSNFLQSLVPAGSGSYPQIRSPKSSDLPVPGLHLLKPAGSGSSLHNKSQQPSGPMGAAITKQALDDIHTSRLTTPPHMRKMQGSQAGHNIFRPGLQLGRILKTGGARRRAPGNTTGVPGVRGLLCSLF